MRNYQFINNNFFDITIYQYGHEACKPRHTFGPAIRNHFLIHYVLSGKGTLVLGTTVYTIQKGQAFLIEPNKLIHYSADPEDPWEYMWIEFEGLKAREYVSFAGLSHNSPVYTTKTEEGSKEVCQYLRYIVDHPNAPVPEIMGYTYLFFNALIQHSKNAKILYKNDIREYYIQTTVSFIEEHYMEDISVENMASTLNLNRSYFSKLFKKMTQKSPQEFLIIYRINKSCELLRSTNMSIAEISVLVGYPNQFHFTRAFKKVMDMPPSEWRKSNLNL